MTGTGRCRFLDNAAGSTLLQGRSPQSRDFNGARHNARRCDECGHVFFEAPPAAELERHYNGAYPAMAASWYNPDDDYAASKTDRRAARIVEIAARFGFGASHAYHEIGCAFGGTVDALNRLGYDTTGTDLNAQAIARGREIGNTAIHAEDDLTFLRRTDRRPNVVYGYHVLEHMPDPVGYLRSLSALLAPDSIAILCVPNATALFPSAYGFDRYIWFAYPEHINYLSPHSAGCLATAAGYDLAALETFPWGLEPEATARALGEPDAGPIGAALRDRLAHDGLAEEELVIVLTPSGGPVATRHPPAQIPDRRTFELELRRIGRDTLLPWPPVDAKAERARIAAEAETLRQSLRATEHRAEQAEIHLNAMRVSTFWRMTAWPRRLVDRLTGRG